MFFFRRVFHCDLILIGGAIYSIQRKFAATVEASEGGGDNGVICM